MAIQAKIVDLDPGKDKDGKDGKTPPRTATAQKKAVATDSDLKARLLTCFERIADAAEARGDEELAGAVREDMGVMAGSLVSLTRPLTALRAPLLLGLAVLEPVMAFSRLGRLMFGRLTDRRMREPETDVTPGN